MKFISIPLGFSSLDLTVSRKVKLNYICLDIRFVEGTTQCGLAYGKSYYISQHIKSQWINTRSICQSFGMDSLSIETAEEQSFFLNLCDENIKLFDDWTHVGAMTTVGKSTDKWYWASTGKKINYPIKWGVNQPDFAGANEFCMVVMKRAKNFEFNDVICQGAYDLKFICQKNDY